MSEVLRKRPAPRRRAAMATPAPAAEGGAPVQESVGSMCGHSGCGGSPTCNVRYVGAVSHVRDHHALHAARGVGHIWAASIITGFAVVLTGVVAFQSAQASTPKQVDQLAVVMQRLDRLEMMVQETRTACGGDQTGDGRLVPTDDMGMLLKKKSQMEPGSGTGESVTASTTAPGIDDVFPARKK